MSIDYKKVDDLCQRFKQYLEQGMFLTEEEHRIIYLALVACKAQLENKDHPEHPNLTKLKEQLNEV